MAKRIGTLSAMALPNGQVVLAKKGQVVKVFDRKDKSKPRVGDKTTNLGGFKYNVKWEAPA